MKFDSGFLRSKVARRFFQLFIFCALLPMVVLTILSFGQVTRQLTLQSHKRLQEETKAYGMSLYERLLLLDADLEVLTAHARLAELQTNTSGHFGERLRERFKAIGGFSSSKGLTSIIGDRMIDLPELAPVERENLLKGKTVLIAQPQADQPTRIFIVKPVQNGKEEQYLLYGEIIPAYVWGIGFENFLPAQTELFVLDVTKKVLISSHQVPENMAHMMAFRQDGNTLRQFEYQRENTTYLASYWSVFLKSNFFSQPWMVVLGQSKAEVLDPLTRFKIFFPLVVILSLLTVLFLSLVFIRRTLAPVEVLTEGTRRVAQQDFLSRVTVKSGDEFEELALSFNSMTEQLDSQFKSLNTRAEIDRAILSSLDSGKIVNTALTHIQDLFICDFVAFSLINQLQENTGQLFYLQNLRQKKTVMEIIKISEAEARLLTSNSTYLVCDKPEITPAHLSVFVAKGIDTFQILPIFLKNRLAGFITFGATGRRPLTDKQLLQARHLADQLSVALSNARLIEDMEHLTIGTIEALARTVDAKSSWTSGHSERVAEIAVKIAVTMGMDEKQIKTLYRGGLLHDIGKIGIPVAILDKPGKLTEDEYAKIKDHPLIGAKILEPINAYADIIPIVSQHHERFDGKGYPFGLSGKEIDINARILSVADVYDALIASRPYRQGWIKEKVTELIKNESGGQFDPDVVEAFLGYLSTTAIQV